MGLNTILLFLVFVIAIAMILGIAEIIQRVHNYNLRKKYGLLGAKKIKEREKHEKN